MRSDWLAAFAVFAEHLNFTHAAAAMHMSQPALHAQVTRLSEAVGAPLYTRQGRALHLTPAGLEVARFARQDVARRHEFLDQLHQRRRSAPIILAAGQGAYLYILGAGIERFRATHQVPLRLWTLDRQRCLDALGSGRAQLGVTVYDEDMERWEVTTLARYEPMLAVPSEHPLATEPRLTLEALRDQPLVVPPPGSALRQQLSLALSARSVPWKVEVEASGWPLMLHFVALGLGLAVVNGCCVAPKGVALVPLEGLASTRYVIVHQPGGCDDATEALKKCLMAQRAAPG